MPILEVNALYGDITAAISITNSPYNSAPTLGSWTPDSRPLAFSSFLVISDCFSNSCRALWLFQPCSHIHNEHFGKDKLFQRHVQPMCLAVQYTITTLSWIAALRYFVTCLICVVEVLSQKILVRHRDYQENEVYSLQWRWGCSARKYISTDTRIRVSET